MENKGLLNDESARNILKEMNEKYEIDKLEELIKNNKAEFTHKDKKYRIRLLDSPDKEELDNYRRKKYSSLIQETDENGHKVNLFEKDLIKIYKERGIDIDAIKEEVKKLEAEQFALQLKLGDALTKDAGDPILKTYKDEIGKIVAQINIKTIQKGDLLIYSFENQLINYTVKIITWLSLDISVDDEWDRAFKTLEDFSKCKDEELIGRATKFALLLQYC